MIGSRELRLVTARSRSVALEDNPDEDLMLAASVGSREAFGVLVTRYLGRLTSYCAKLTSDDRIAEEFAQDVLLAVWRTRRDYHPGRPFRVFLFTIASNRCRNHARSWRRGLRWFGRRGEAEALDAVPALDAGQLDRMLAEERRRRVRRALAALPARARDVLLLRFEQDLSHAEIAEITGSTESTVRSRVFHALRKLELALEEDRS
jgi:RNA polymerase sigma-70 factor (ECF subfamily)